MPALSVIHLFQCLRYVPMLRKLTEYIFAVCDLLEAQGRALRQTVRRTALGMVVLLVGGLLLAAGLGFIIAGIYLILAAALTPWAGALITGAIVIVLGGVVAWIGLHTAR